MGVLARARNSIDGRAGGYCHFLSASSHSGHANIAVISAFSQNEAMNEAEILKKLHRLEVTDSHLERNSLALELSDTKEPRLFRHLVELIQRPELVNNRGMLVYCLKNYDCSSIVDLLVELAESGNFEVSAGAEIILNEQRLR
ncbi:hypothetical protein [Novosphingobium album (ex Hu et al. 2023)]|uniref:HEAT repeat domain-containing protein n=1 Tax=Novosphingobium album (ex Hu et al. 2023) TaxID=2930093 RepID=A0ABT0AX39_9SPHN|nr:hypothetical protein [Novosphingobium album (ex Hu et al. 2023)]MCJ2177370.1 hypothetical protein [Novosphingobium album (ex Hu et al. 2023)]